MAFPAVTGLTGSELPGTELRFRSTWIGLGVLAVAVVIAASLLRVPAPPGPPGIDKFLHVIAYGVLMGWWGMVQPVRRVAGSPGP